MMTAAMPSPTSKKSTKPSKTAPEPAGRKRSVLTEVGEEAKRAAMRKRLIAELRSQGWNFTKTAEALGMGNGSSGASNVSRALKDLAPEEYAAAKADGRITNYRRDD